MQLNTEVNIIEENLIQLSIPLLDTLLKDKTTKRNIIWATSDFESLGINYDAKYQIMVQKISGIHSNIIQPRITKAKEQKAIRTREKAEVFTPSWININLHEVRI